MSERLFKWFPALRNSSKYQIIGAPDPRRNCICHAIGDPRSRRYWPTFQAGWYWPHSLPKSETIESFQALFETKRYQICANGHLESGIEKVAIFALKISPKHAALQTATGVWTSKLGIYELIEHGISDLNGTQYGMPVLFMSRRRNS